MPTNPPRSGPAPPPPTAGLGAGAPRNAYQAVRASSDRTQRCPNRNGIWPPLYKRQWDPHPPRSLDNHAQQRFYRCVQDAVAARELHRTTADVILAFARASDDRLSDVWISQATVAERLELAESTVCHHVATAKRLGWVAVQHRNRIDQGYVLAMSNNTRLQLPAQWQERVDEQRRQRTAEQTRRRRGRGRTTPPPHPRSKTDSTGQEPNHPTPAQQAASFGAATAGSAATATFEEGRQQLEDQYNGRPALYEAAYDAFSELWRTIRKNE